MRAGTAVGYHHSGPFHSAVNTLLQVVLLLQVLMLQVLLLIRLLLLLLLSLARSSVPFSPPSLPPLAVAAVVTRSHSTLAAVEQSLCIRPMFLLFSPLSLRKVWASL